MNTDPRRTRLILISVVTVCALLAPTPAAAEPDGSPGAPAASRDESGLSAAAVATAERADQHGVALQPAVLTELDTQGVADFWVGFSERADLAGAAEISDWAARGRYVHRRLVETAQASQAELTTRLRLAGVGFEPFWIANTVLVRGADQAVLDGVVAQPGVVEVRADEVVVLPDPIRPDAGGQAGVAAVEWGIANIRADQVWSELGVRGEGIVVGSIDTGVDFTHPALVDQYRGNLGDGVFDHDYQWWDPSGVCPDPQPCDNNDHGTHTTGTMVGDDGTGNAVGVAPSAQWIAAKGCEARNCSAGALLSSGQFMLAPTNLAGGDPRPELRPHVLNNSWSGAGGDPWYDQMVAAWVAAGIFPAFANDNTGPGCGTAGAPADGPDAYAVGAYDAANLIADFSSRGPGRDGEIRPDISAPGVSVRSAVRGGGYGVGSGTSMATPHLAGTVALMWSASGLVGDIPTTRAALDATAVDTEDLSCGGNAADNNVYGQGRLDALASTLELAVNSGIAGTVSDTASEQPLSGVRIQGAGSREGATDEAGRYTLRLEPGRYTLAFSRFGYDTRTVPDVVVDEEIFTTVDVGLAPSPSGRVTGTVTDLASGHTIPGVAVEVLDVPLPFQATTGAGGGFEFPPLPVGTYRIQATISRPGLWWPPEVAQVTVRAGEAADIEIRLPRAEGVERVSVSSDGEQASRSSNLGPRGAISADGRYVTFRSPAPNLVDSPLPQEYNVYIHDRHTGVTELVPGGFYHASLSGDGRYAAYSGPAGQVAERQPELPPLPRYWPDLANRVYVLDRTTGQLALASANGAGEAVGITPGTQPAMTPDGRFVAYDSNAPQLVDGPPPRNEQASFFELRHAMPFQAVVYDRATGASDIVSVSNDGALANGGGVPQMALTPDGRYVAFRSLATNLVDEPTNPGHDIFVHDRVTGVTEWVSVLETPSGLLTEIARPIISDNGDVVLYNRGFGLAGFYDRVTGEAAELTVPLAGVPHVFSFSAGVAVSGDGRRVTFVQATLADAALETVVPEGTGVFVLDLDTGALSKLRDIDWNGPEDTGFAPSQQSRDGRFWLGDTNSDDLVPGGTNGFDHTYVVDLAYQPDQPQPRFAVWDLSVAPALPRPGEPVEVTVRVKNVGDIAGEYEAALLVDDVREAGANGTVALAPGEVAEVTLPVAREAGGGYRVRIGQAAGEFRVQAGTLAGHVTDANDEAPVDGATVTATHGGTTRTTTTLGGAYQLDDLQVGTWAVRVDAGNYVTESQQVVFTEDEQRVTHDVTLHTGVLAVDRTGVEATLPAGATGTVDVELANSGSADLAWNAYAWESTTGAEPSVLMYTSAGIADTYVDQALGRLGLDYTAFREDGGCDLSPPWDGLDRFGEALRAGDWDLAIVDHPCGFARLSPATAEALEDHVQRGGALIIHSVQLRKDPQLPLWETLGLRFVTELPSGHGPYAAYSWDADHPLFTSPLPVPAFAGKGEDMVDPVGGSEALAGYTLTARPDHAALVLGHDGRTLYLGFRPQQPADLDGNGVPDGVQLLVNSIAEVGRLAAQPWLTVTDSGELRPDQSATVPVSIDASRLAPGSYHGTVTLATDAGLEPQVAVPVTLTVTPSPECDRTITGTHRGPIVITSGITCLVDGARVVGPVSVRPGAGLIATGASVTGAVLATGATIVDLRENSLAGPVRLANGTGLVRVSANEINGPISLVHNHTGQDPIVVSGNRIVGPLFCVGNQPPPVNQGIPNTGTGPRAGQCVGL